MLDLGDKSRCFSSSDSAVRGFGVVVFKRLAFLRDLGGQRMSAPRGRKACGTLQRLEGSDAPELRGPRKPSKPLRVLQDAPDHRAQSLLTKLPRQRRLVLGGIRAFKISEQGFERVLELSIAVYVALKGYSSQRQVLGEENKQTP